MFHGGSPDSMPKRGSVVKAKAYLKAFDMDPNQALLRSRYGPYILHL